MTKPDVTPEQRLTILKHLAGGKDLDVVATITHRDRSEVLDVASRHGYPDRDKLAWAAGILEKKINGAAAPTEHPQAAKILAHQQIHTRPAAGASTPPAAGPATTTVSEHHTLIDRGKQHPSKRIQAAANKVLDDLARLRTLLTEDHEKNAERRKEQAAKDAARAEVTRLEKQLADAKAKLRGKPAVQKPAPGGPSDGPAAADIRAWAVANDVECPGVGRVPANVREAYNNAHQHAEAS
ncbi:Lsr2 family protein [Nocardioides sp. InS609-2]|uniref:Lsr2 family protein n=1 Tax=Nocardioides sp. InS609-2 TaxID=2760705 RepID=UPI0020C04B99|nr:Lsr2 family protein [Nocardioides sp. InS609-2]